MLLLSIDVGIRNLGMCLIDTSTKKIKNWDATGIPPQHSNGIFVCLRDHFRDRPWVLESSKVIIERQPDKNKTMKSVENFIHAYFICSDKDVQLYDARFKVPDVVGPGRAMYIKRKKMSVERCTEFITEHNSEYTEWFSQQKKKDDLADSVMQALSYIDSVPYPSEVRTQSKKSPRKPTVNQRETRYSRANLAWLHLHGTDDKKRFEKDLKIYYKNIEEMLAEFNIL
jgi:hypothetical protein